MKIEIDIEDMDILESYEDYDKEYKPTAHRRWGRMSWLYPDEIVVQISARSAKIITQALREEDSAV